MKEIDCDVIKDLLPSYIDKTASDSTKIIVEEHLKNCKDCSALLENVKNATSSSKEGKEIDYLKGYRRKKQVSIIITSIITILILVMIIYSVIIFLKNKKFYIDVNSLNVYATREEITNDGKLLIFETQDEKLQVVYEYDVLTNSKGQKEIFIDISGKYPFESPSKTSIFADVNEKIDRVYLRDKNNKLKLLWDKENGIVVEKSQLFRTSYRGINLFDNN